MKFINKAIVLIYGVMLIVLVSGCATNNYTGGFKANSSPSECYNRGYYPYIFNDGSIYCYKDKGNSNVASSPDDCYRKNQYPYKYHHNLLICKKKKKKSGDSTKNIYHEYSYDKSGYNKDYKSKSYNNKNTITHKRSSSHTYILGRRGGCYYINSNGNKTYVAHTYCR